MRSNVTINWSPEEEKLEQTNCSLPKEIWYTYPDTHTDAYFVYIDLPKSYLLSQSWSSVILDAMKLDYIWYICSHAN